LLQKEQPSIVFDLDVALVALGQIAPAMTLPLPISDSGPWSEFRPKVLGNHLQSVYDDAYYYAGLACGITLMNLDFARR
jgi:hypothetical protein